MMAARIPLDLAVQMILDDEEPIKGFDSESDMSDEEDPDCPSGTLRPSTTQPPHPPDEHLLSDMEESSDEASEEEEEIDRPIISNQMSRKGSYWAETPPRQGRTPIHNIVRSRPGPAPGLTTVSPIDAWKLFITDNIIEEVLMCTNLEGRRVAESRGKTWEKSKQR